eukprot:scaffold50418_cov19-Tisochrysis_lutea.AAC.1
MHEALALSSSMVYVVSGMVQVAVSGDGALKAWYEHHSSKAISEMVGAAGACICACLCVFLGWMWVCGGGSMGAGVWLR